MQSSMRTLGRAGGVTPADPAVEAVGDAASASWRAVSGIPSGITDARLGQAEVLLASDPHTLAPSQWSHLADLLEDPQIEVALRLNDQFFANGPPASTARSIASGSGLRTPDAWPTESHLLAGKDRQAQRWLGALGLEQQPVSVRADLLDELLHQSPHELDRADWARLSALAFDAPTRAELAAPLRQWHMISARATEFVRGEGEPSGMDVHMFREYVLERQPLSERAALLRLHMGRSPDELSRDDWGDLSLLAASGDVTAAASFSDNFPGAGWSLSQLAKFHSNGSRLVAGTRAYFDRAAVAAMTPGERVDVARTLMLRHPSDVAPDQWIRLATLGDDPVVRNELGIPDNLSTGGWGVDPFSKLALQQTSLSTDQMPERLRRFLIEWRSGNDPTFEARVTAAIEQVAAGRGDALDIRTIADVGDRLPGMVHGRPPIEQVRLAEAVLAATDAPTPGRTSSVLRPLQSHLDDLRQRLDNFDAPPAARQLVAETLELVERNMARVQGRGSSGGGVGYLNYPDYAELGRIRANVSLIRMLTEQTPTASAGSTFTW